MHVCVCLLYEYMSSLEASLLLSLSSAYMYSQSQFLSPSTTNSHINQFHLFNPNTQYNHRYMLPSPESEDGVAPLWVHSDTSNQDGGQGRREPSLVLVETIETGLGGYV